MTLPFFLSLDTALPRAGGLRLKATVQKVYGKRKDKDDRDVAVSLDTESKDTATYF